MGGPRGRQAAAAHRRAVRGVDAPLADLGYYRSTRAAVAGASLLLSRTGYTGEDGFELYVRAADAGAVWDTLREADASLQPIGLAARDTLRFEVGYCLYGNDIGDDTSPLEAGLGWTVKLKKDEFVGREALVEQKAAGVGRRLVGLQPDGRRSIPRPGYGIRHDGRPAGAVAEDFTVLGGSLGINNFVKKNRMIELATRDKLPLSGCSTAPGREPTSLSARAWRPCIIL